MKTKLLPLAWLALSLLTTTPTRAEVEWEISGHMSADYSTTRSPADRGLHLGATDIDFWPIVTIRNEDAEITINADLSDIFVNDANWLKAAFILWSQDEDNIFLAGRIPTTGNLLTEPAKRLETAYFQHAPVGIWGYGAQWKHKQGRWITVWDVTSDSDDSFQTGIRGLDSGLRIQYDLAKNWAVGVGTIVDIDDGVFFNYVDLSYNNGPFGSRLLSYEKDGLYGLYNLTKYSFCGCWEAHVGLDTQDGGSTSQVIGLRYFFDTQIDLTVDYVHSNFAREPGDSLDIRIRQQF